MDTREKAIVIGAGIGGLAASVRLAAKGYAVEVYEAADGPGGKLGELTSGGYRFDRGLYVFTRPDLVEELFDVAGVPMEGRFAYHRLEESNRYFWEDGTEVTGWSDPGRLAVEMESRLGVDRDLVMDHLRRADELLRSTGRTFMERSLQRWRDLPRDEVFRSLASIGPGELFNSLHRTNEKALGGVAKAVQLFDRFATYNGSDPHRTPGLMRMIAGLEHGQGAYYPEGGMYRITEAIHRLAVDLGVDFHFNAPVERILLNMGQDHVQGVLVNGRVRDASVVVSNMDILPTYRHLLPDLKAPERVLRQERSSSALVFYWGVRARLPRLGLHNILFSRDYRNEFGQLFDALRPPEDPTVYINITNVHTPDDAPEGCSNWFTMINAPRDVGQYSMNIVAQAREHILAKIERTLGRDIAPLIEVEEVLDPRGIAARTSSHQGSIYGTSSNSPWAAFLRHGNSHRKVRGLLFCGGSVHPGGGIPLALLSARIATSSLAQVAEAPRLRPKTRLERA